MRFRDITGHTQAKERLRDMIDKGQMPHALVLEGPSGIGKFMLARAAVQYLHCTDRRDGDSCGRCPSCLQHQSFNHIDTIYSFPVLKSAGGATSDEFLPLWRTFLKESELMDEELWQSMLGNPNGQPVIYVDESVEIIKKLNFTSHGADYKVVVMWLPEKMNVQCANKLLKLIEEPLPGVILMLVSNNPSMILPTVYSRLQRLEIKRLDDQTVKEYLMGKVGMPADKADEIAHNASGSLLRARNLAVTSKESGMFLELFMQLMRLAYTRNIAALRKWSQEVSQLGRESAARFCAYCQEQTRENFITNLRMPQLNYQTGSEREFSSRFSPFINHKNVEALTTLFSKARIDILANGNGRIIFFDVAIKVILLLKK